MDFDVNDSYLLPKASCPESCGECGHYDGSGKYTYCTANGHKTATFAWKTPRGSIISRVPPCCPWWYVAVDGTQEERRERFWWLVGQKATANMDRERRLELIQHVNAVGGMDKVDRKTFPEVQDAYDRVRETMGIPRKGA